MPMLSGPLSGPVEPQHGRVIEDEACVLCSEWAYTECFYCEDPICEDDAHSLPGYSMLHACLECLDKHHPIVCYPARPIPMRKVIDAQAA